MNKILNVLVAFVCLVSCAEKFDKEVVSVYPNGTPMQVLYSKNVNGKKLVVKETRFYPNAEKSSEGEWTPDNKKTGTWTQWYVSGEKWIEETYVDGKREGDVTVWQDNGEKEFEGSYKNDLPAGTWRFYDKKGKKIKEQKY